MSRNTSRNGRQAGLAVESLEGRRVLNASFVSIAPDPGGNFGMASYSYMGGAGAGATVHVGSGSPALSFATIYGPHSRIYTR